LPAPAPAPVPVPPVDVVKGTHLPVKERPLKTHPERARQPERRVGQSRIAEGVLKVEQGEVIGEEEEEEEGEEEGEKEEEEEEERKRKREEEERFPVRRRECWTFIYVIKMRPNSLWGVYKESSDP